MALVASCDTKEPNKPSQDPQEPQETESIAFTAKIKGGTRATDLQFEEGDEISVFATEGESLSESNYAQNVCYNYEDNMFSTDGVLSYPSASQDLTFYAVYPYAKYDTPNFLFEIQTDQREHENYTLSDLMTASAVGNNNKVVDLVFNHRLSKLIINITSENMPIGEPVVTLKNVKYIASASLNSNEFTSVEGAYTDVIAAPNGTNSFKVLLPPQAFTKDSALAEIVIGNKTFTWILDRDMVLNSGVEYSYTIELKDNVVFTAQINPWGTPEEIESVIPEEYIEILEPYIPIYPGVTPPNVEGTFLISPNVLLTDNVGFEPGCEFAPDYIKFYNQTADNTISKSSTQLLGDLIVGEGLFISGEGENFTIYCNEYTTCDNGSWLITAAIISGSIVDGNLCNYVYAFIVLDEYDTEDKYMDKGQYRILYDLDGISEPVEWPLNTRATSSTKGISNFSNKI